MKYLYFPTHFLQIQLYVGDQELFLFLNSRMLAAG